MTLFAQSLAGLWFVVLLFLAGCASAPEAPKPIPLTDEEIAFLNKLDDHRDTGVEEDIPTLFFKLKQDNSNWYASSLFKEKRKDIRIYTSLGAILTRRVYMNFDRILSQFEHGPQPHRVIAALSLGFSRIPDNPNFPQLYPRAIPALLRALDSGDDAIVENALLGLYVLGEPGTDLTQILPLVIDHHNPDVRANAALCISALADPAMTDEIMPYIYPALKDDDSKVRLHAINVVYELKAASAVAPLTELMNDRYDLIRANAARTLGELGDRAACTVLIKNLDHGKEIVRFNCLTALKRLTGEDFGDDVEDWGEWWSEYLQQQHAQ